MYIAVVRKLILVVLFPPLAAFFCFAQSASGKNATQSSQTQIAGVWRGNSTCMVKDSPCHDELNVYHFSEATGKAGFFSVTASRVVNGQEIVMGTIEFKYDANKHTLQGENAAGTFLFTIDGAKMEGSLTLRDKTLYRRIHLTRQD